MLFTKSPSSPSMSLNLLSYITTACLITTLQLQVYASPLPLPTPLPNPNPAPLPGFFSGITSIAGDIFGSGSSSSNLPSVSNDVFNSQFTRPAQFARLAYCTGSAVQTMTCGPFCDVLSGTTVYQVGGDDGLIPMYYIAHDATEQQIVVAHQGTDPSNILSVLNDIQFELVDIDTTRFPSANGKGIQVHDGFQKTFERTADGVLSGVQQGLSQFGVNKVLVVGHSLGAAVASLDSMMLKDALDSSVSIQTITIGMPRVGNQAWANFVDQTLPLTFITNQNDPVPRVPFEDLGFVHPSGEIHIKSLSLDPTSGSTTSIDAVSCPGQDNESCSSGIGVVDISVANHLGPYFNNITLTSGQC